MKKNILDVEVSCFRNYQTPHSPKSITLDKWLISNKYSNEVNRIRNTKCKKERNSLKSLLPAITPSGMFTYRSSDQLVRHSGFLQVDIDFSDNLHISNYDSLKQELIKIENFAYLGLSVSGNGYWGLVPISQPEKHSAHFDALVKIFKKLGIKIDASCRDFCRLRGYSSDDSHYLNYNAKPFTELVEKNKPPLRRTIKSFSNDSNQSFNYCLNEIQRLGIDISSGDYKTWYDIGCALANEFGDRGEQYFVIISNQYKGKQSIRPERQFKHCLKSKNGFSIGTFFYHCKISNILYKP